MIIAARKDGGAVRARGTGPPPRSRRRRSPDKTDQANAARTLERSSSETSRLRAISDSRREYRGSNPATKQRDGDDRCRQGRKIVRQEADADSEETRQ